MSTATTGYTDSVDRQGSWQQSLEENQEITRKRRLRVGAKVVSEHGKGVITGHDHPYRFVVSVTDPLPESKEMVARFKEAKLCYFPKELTVLEQEAH